MKKLCLLLLASLVLVSCGKLHGEFGFRYTGDQAYKRDLPRYEFDSAKEVDWVYKFDSVSGRASIGVIIMKKELGWIDILTTQDYVDEFKQIVYGNLKELEPGDYKLVLIEMSTVGSRTIDEREFYIYSDEEPLEEPSDE